VALVAFTSALHANGQACFARDTYRFTARPPQVGDRSQQELRFLLDVKMSVSQSGQIVYTSDGNVERTQSRSVEVGETVRLPNPLAKELFGSWDQLGEVSQLDLMLLGTQTIEGARCALFHTKIEVRPPKSSGGTTQIEGRFLIEIDTCRTAQVELSGPVTTSQVRGEGASQFTVKRRGSMEIAVQTRHDRAMR